MRRSMRSVDRTFTAMSGNTTRVWYGVKWMGGLLHPLGENPIAD